MKRTLPETLPAAGRTLAGMALIFLATFSAYAPVLRAGFIWNDRDYVTKPALQSLAGLGRIWSTLGATEQYYPLLHSAFWAEHRLWGDAPLGYHLLNVALHATAACLLALVLRRLALPGAWLAAFVFALHPVAVESVAWIAEQKNTLSTVFYLLAALGYLHFLEQRRPGRYAAATVFFMLAIFSKTVAATLPAALLVLAWWRYGKLSWRRDLAPLLPWLLVGAAAGGFSGWVEARIVGAAGPDFALTGLQRLLLAARAVWFYMGKLLWPANLIFIYPRWTIDPGSLAAYGYLASAGAAFLALLALRRWTRAPLAASLIFVGALLPTLGFFNVYAFVYSYVADHWQYLAASGMIASVCAGVARAARGAPRWLQAIGTGAVLAGLAALTFRQAGRYRDMETFYRTTLAQNPACWMADNNLASMLREEGHRDREAIGLFQAALRIRPDLPVTHRNLGVTLAGLGRLSEAAAEARAALRLVPNYAEAHNDLGIVLYRLGQLPAALAEYNSALGLDPNFAAAHYNRGLVHSDLGQVPAGLADFSAAVRLNPNLPGARASLAAAHNNLGTALAQSGDLAAATAHYREALRWNPQLAPARANLTLALRALGREPEGSPESPAPAKTH